MKDQTSKLWVIKFCLKLIYPKFNYLTFLVFLAIKFRIRWQKKISSSIKDMNAYKIKTISTSLQQILVQEYLENNQSVVLHKCMTISREEFIQLSSENLFYIDNGVLWVALKITKKTKRICEQKKNKDKSLDILHQKYNFIPLESQRNFNYNNSCNKADTIRIVPIVGCKLVKENVAFTTEYEYYNIQSCFGLEHIDDVQVSFHPMPSIDCSPKIAASAEVSLLLNDYELSNDFVKEILSNHFELPKLVSLNDIFSINLTPNITGKYHYTYLDLVENMAKLYFKCTKVNENLETVKNDESNQIVKPYFIIKGVTQLTLGESIHSIKPKDEYIDVKEMTQKNINLCSLCPTGLKEKFKEIQETIVPFVNGDISELSTSLLSPIIPLFLLTGLVGSGRHTLVKILSRYNGINYMQVDCNSLQSTTAKQTESKINGTIQKAKAASPVIVLLDNFEVFAIDPENNEDCRVIEYFMKTIDDLYQNYTKHPIIFIAVAERQDLKPNILRMFLEKFHIPRLNSQQRYQMLQWFTSVMHLSINGEESVRDKVELSDGDIADGCTAISEKTNDVLQRVASKTETFLYGDIDTLLHFAMRESYLKQQSSYHHIRPNPDMKLLDEEDFNLALESIRSLQSQHLDAPKIPKVYWEDIGGLEKLKKELLKTIEFPIKYPHLFKDSSLKRSGILLYGPPGCGKTLVAKAVSTELNVSFLSVKGPELLNMYIGQSEENVRKVFESARASSPCIVFLDELDALAPRRGAAGDSGGASDRVVSQLLAEIDGVTDQEDADSSSFVFIMGATNRPDLLEQSLLRPGRLDKLIYVGPYRGNYEKTSVLKALTRNYKLQPEVRLEDVAAALPDQCTGADLLAVVDSARASAVRGLVAKLHNGLLKESELNQESIVLGAAELLQGIETFRPSVTEDELAYYESLQTQM